MRPSPYLHSPAPPPAPVRAAVRPGRARWVALAAGGSVPLLLTALELGRGALLGADLGGGLTVGMLLLGLQTVLVVAGAWAFDRWCARWYDGAHADERESAEAHR